MNTLEDWFRGFGQGLESLAPGDRARLLSPCARKCVEGPVLDRFKRVYDEADGDLDRFFLLTDLIAGVGGAIEVPGERYELSYDSCTCHLRRAGLVDALSLCECSRQSILCVLRELWPHRSFEVTARQSIFGGADSCRFGIVVR